MKEKENTEMTTVNDLTVNQATIGKTFEKERGRLLNFIRKRVKTLDDAEDILQDVFYQFIRVSTEVEAIERASSWLFQVARNRITDLYRKKKPANFSQFDLTLSDDEEALQFENFIPDLNDLPDSNLTKEMVWETLEEGLAELPEEQRMVFQMHEFEDMSFKEISDKTGEGVNTLISRKRYAILHLRNKLAHLYNEIIYR